MASRLCMPRRAVIRPCDCSGTGSCLDSCSSLALAIAAIGRRPIPLKAICGDSGYQWVILGCLLSGTWACDAG